MIDGYKMMAMCSNKNNNQSLADIIFTNHEVHDIFIEIDMRFDMESTYDEEGEDNVSPIGFQMRVFGSF